LREVSIRKGGKGKSESEKGKIASRGGAKSVPARSRHGRGGSQGLKAALKITIRIHGRPAFSGVSVGC
jgi:hypothetical protein